MPYFCLETNVPDEKIPADLPAKLCEVMAESSAKPLDVCCASVTGGVKMSWGGNNEPAALATFVGLAAIGVIGVEENKKHTKAFTDYLTKSIGIRADRIYITFIDAKTSGLGSKGTTYHEIYGF
ncbi:unnamed protein product [Phaedon cochleariae]|uniref:L-dopachrome isomerase n=1 Tax=Phaedon cochleariae TaxID=80249 RepID=A0A9N9SB01_PHACE|nr:unnamed protein product [Phaedon cochleariae]